jgi:hypothetical protein
MDRNIGFGKACNEAVRQSTGRYLFFLNPDTALGNDAVPVLLRFYEERSPDRPEPGCMGVLLRDEQGNPVHSFGEFPRAGRLIRKKCGSLLRKVFGVSLAEMSTDSIFSSSGFLISKKPTCSFDWHKNLLRVISCWGRILRIWADAALFPRHLYACCILRAC